MSIPNLPANTVYAVHLRAASVTGGKDWVGAVTGNCEIHTFWGKTGQINQTAAKPGNNIDLQKLIDQKKKGKDQYFQVDDYTQKVGWGSQKPQSVPASQSPSPKQQVAPQAKLNPVIDWNNAPAPASAIEWDF